MESERKLVLFLLLLAQQRCNLVWCRHAVVFKISQFNDDRRWGENGIVCDYNLHRHRTEVKLGFMLWLGQVDWCIFDMTSAFRNAAWSQRNTRTCCTRILFLCGIYTFSVWPGAAQTTWRSPASKLHLFYLFVAVCKGLKCHRSEMLNNKNCLWPLLSCGFMQLGQL